MNIVARFNMGKTLNLVQRGSYERRVYRAGLRFNRSFNWHTSPWKRCVQRSPGQYFKAYMEKHSIESLNPRNSSLQKRYREVEQTKIPFFSSIFKPFYKIMLFIVSNSCLQCNFIKDKAAVPI